MHLLEAIMRRIWFYSKWIITVWTSNFLGVVWWYVQQDMQFCALGTSLAHSSYCQQLGMEFAQSHFLDLCSGPQGAALLLWADWADSCIILLVHLFFMNVFVSASSVDAILTLRQKREIEWFNSHVKSIVQHGSRKAHFLNSYDELLNHRAIKKQNTKFICLYCNFQFTKKQIVVN